MINIPINHNRWAIKHRNGEMKIFFSSLFLICIKCLRPENELVWLGRLVTKRVGLRVFFVVVFLGEGGDKDIWIALLKYSSYYAYSKQTS